MRIHRLLVRDFRGVREREIGFADTGVTVVHGPNEAGKTSMVEALHLLLDHSVKATSKSQRVAALCPVDRDAGPFVEAELTMGPYRFVYAKQYYRRPGATLTVLAPTPLQLTGGSAEAWVTEQMKAHVDPDLFAALQVMQGPAATLPSLRDSSALAAALDSASGWVGGESGWVGGESGGTDEAGAEALSAAVAAQRARYFTPTGRATGELSSARTRAETAEDRYALAQESLSEVDRVVDRHAETVAEVASAEDRGRTAASAYDVVSAQQGRIAQLEAEVTHARVALESAALREQHAGEAANRRRRLITQHGHAGQRAADVRVRRDKALAEREVLAAEASWLDLTVQELTSVAADRRERKMQAQYAVDYAREAARYQKWCSQIEQAELLGKDVDAATRRLGENPMDRRALRSVMDAEKRLATADTRFTALAATLRLERLGFGDVLVDGRHLGANPIEVVAGNGTAIEVPGAVRIEVVQRGESADAAAEVIAARAAVLSACTEAGAADGAQARELHEQRAAIEVELHSAEVALARVLGAATLTELQVQAHESAQRIVELERAVDPELLAADTETAKQNLLVSTQGEVEARAQESQARAQLTHKQQELHRATADARSAADSLQHFDSAAQEFAAELDEARAADTDQALQAAADSAATARVAAADLLTERQRAAADADVDGFAVRLAAARTEAEAARAAEAATRERLAGFAAQLSLFQADGRRDRFDAAAAELVHARRALSSVEQRARAADLLHTTLTEHRDARRARVQAPFQQAVEELGRSVFGDRLTITVGDDLGIESRTVDGTTVSFDSLSGGAKEQLGVLSRLAVARLVDPADGAPVIFDDTLGHSDPARLAAMADALVVAGQSAQVIVFSCVRGRFEALRERDGVTEVELS